MNQTRNGRLSSRNSPADMSDSDSVGVCVAASGPATRIAMTATRLLTKWMRIPGHSDPVRR